MLLQDCSVCCFMWITQTATRRRSHMSTSPDPFGARDVCCDRCSSGRCQMKTSFRSSVSPWANAPSWCCRTKALQRGSRGSTQPAQLQPLPAQSAGLSRATAGGTVGTRSSTLAAAQHTKALACHQQQAQSAQHPQQQQGPSSALLACTALGVLTAPAQPCMRAQPVAWPAASHGTLDLPLRCRPSLQCCSTGIQTGSCASQAWTWKQVGVAMLPTLLACFALMHHLPQCKAESRPSRHRHTACSECCTCPIGQDSELCDVAVLPCCCRPATPTPAWSRLWQVARQQAAPHSRPDRCSEGPAGFGQAAA
jgi:hypothetical protein